MATQNTVKILSSLLSFEIANWPLADPTLISSNVNPLVMGEWLTRNGSFQLLRAANPGVPPGPWMFWAEHGRAEVQGMSSHKVPVILRGGFMAETLIWNTGAPPALGAALQVMDVTYGGLTRSGLGTHAAGPNPVIGYVTKTGASNNGWLEFQQCLY